MFAQTLGEGVAQCYPDAYAVASELHGSPLGFRHTRTREHVQVGKAQQR
jgi:hypothetical protein